MAQHGNVGCGVVFLWCMYALVLWVMLSDKHAGFEDYLAGSVFGVIGFLILRAIGKWASRSLWYRRN